MAKKPAKRSKARREIVNDPALPLLSGAGAAKPAKRRPLSVSRQRSWNRERERWRESARAAAAARQADRQARLDRRPKQFTDGFTLPDDVRRFAMHLFDAGMYELPTFEQPGDRMMHVLDLLKRLEAAYLQGVTQGYIEGFVSRREPDQKRSATANAGKRKALVTFGNVTMTRNERDALIVAEYSQLVTKMKHTPACQRLAAKYEYESWQGVAAAIKAFHKRQLQ